jgi:ATP-dependent RNA helicase DOB1
MDELFDVFEGQGGSPSDSDEEVAPVTKIASSISAGPSTLAVNSTSTAPSAAPAASKPVDGKKRKADGAIKNGVSEDDDMDVSAMEDGNGDRAPSEEQGTKRRKKDGKSEPRLTDTFQTAESRQVAAVQGLTTTLEPESLVLSHNIQHQVALPPDLDYDYVPLSEHKPPDEPARTWPFELDPFQSLSVASIERDESVLVSAHTSAGKTVVAEYAIAQCLKRKQRVIYTSPIKALSNQKYRDFEQIFGDVGLMTGDVTINPTASCLVMTTEILRSMLYRGSEVMREVAWVVFDEVHYLRDKSRGVVWEETIILLPDKVRYVFLSATIPNAFQFAEWIAKIHHQACHVVYTDFRPTPLQNYMFPAGGDGIYLVVDEKRNFKEDNFYKTMAQVEAATGQTGQDKKKWKKGKPTGADSQSDISKIIRMVMKKNFSPAIVFNFSKRDCENMALQTSGFSFNKDNEKALVTKVFTSAIDCLSEKDRTLPQITHLLPLLQRGIGVHHAGLLPILKETIEILFQESLIKVLFATETFSIGLNMPAKTVIFTQVTKFDGVVVRPLTPSEFVQMSGRAGRRGLDARGIVIMMINEKIEPTTAKEIVIGEQNRLNSAFYLSYNMILNLLRIEAISPEFMLERCFHQFQAAASVPSLERDLMTLQQERDSMAIADEATVKDYYNIRKQIDSYTRDMRAVIQHPNYCIQFLQPGRVVRIYNPKENRDDELEGIDFGWGVIASSAIKRQPPKSGQPAYPAQESYFIDVLLHVSSTSDHIPSNQPDKEMPTGLHPETNEERSRFEIVPCLLTCIKAISALKLLVSPKDLTRVQERDRIRGMLKETKRRCPDGVPIMDPITDMRITDGSFRELMRKIEVLESRLISNPLHESPLLPELYKQYHAKVKMGDKIKDKKKQIAGAHSITQMDELKSRKRVLRRLGFINDGEVVQLKARVACEISSTEGHELLLAELLFDRFFNELSPEICAAVLSCFVVDEKLDTTSLRPELDKPYRTILSKARMIAKVSNESKVAIDEEEYVAKFKYQLMETVLAWAAGKSFADIW